ncbi:hypothetical protein CDN99_02740 [Roseateles aquatilis]|uniref:DUF2783 domain-containing protein n=1 Tax=Roseateles aquatilis TaxID=431061 RepID=A0A246JLC2_9BURK|nr:DUF2783 domain-containing protein [Roseateles aquatilis]OWQ93412.1 hypothetical protein CDN99_02740 [Roseateles aquatilis]
MPLITTPNLEAGDDFYAALLEAHQALTPAASMAFNARLILLMANHIGRQDVLAEALAAAAMADAAPDSAPDSESPRGPA